MYEPKSTCTTREAALREAWEACGKPCSLAEWHLAFAEWEIMPVEVGGEVVGAIFAKGAEVHVAVRADCRKRWATPRLYRWAITDRLREYGVLFTSGKCDNEFIKRAGFRPVSENNGVTLYAMP